MKRELYCGTAYYTTLEEMDADYKRCTKCCPCPYTCMYHLVLSESDERDENAAWCWRGGYKWWKEETK